MSRRFFAGYDAQDELERFVSSYEAIQSGLGNRFKSQVFKTFDRIEAQPYMYARYRGRFRLANVKKFPFAVVYCVSRYEISVVSIIPTRSDPANWFRKR